MRLLKNISEHIAYYFSLSIDRKKYQNFVRAVFPALSIVYENVYFSFRQIILIDTNQFQEMFYGGIYAVRATFSTQRIVFLRNAD